MELKANARTMEEVVAYIEENWGAFRVKITESELMRIIRLPANLQK